MRKALFKGTITLLSRRRNAKLIVRDGYKPDAPLLDELTSNQSPFLAAGSMQGRGKRVVSSSNYMHITYRFERRLFAANISSLWNATATTVDGKEKTKELSIAMSF